MSSVAAPRGFKVNSQAKGNISRHLADVDLEAELNACPFCSEPTSSSCFAMSLQADPVIERRTCQRCHCTYPTRLPTSQYLSQYYRTYYDGDTKRTHINAGRLVNLFATFCTRTEKAPLRVIDFGGGDGGIAIALARRLGQTEAAITVVDHNTVPYPAIPDGYQVSYLQSLDEDVQPADGTKQYDIALASAVLEHVPDMRQSLDGLLDRLTPGGVFYARTPFTVPLQRCSKRFGVHFDTNFPAHLYDQGQAFWEGCLEILGKSGDYRIEVSRPSIVETDWLTRPVVTLIASAMKAPWYIFRRNYSLVGGWEVVIRRRNV
jgi:SAM-dependent methyltransferase